MSDQLDLAPIKARLAATTIGVWRITEDYYDGPLYGLSVSVDNSDDSDLLSDGAGNRCDETRANVEFAAAAHNEDVPALIEEVERLRAEVEALKASKGLSAETLQALMGDPY